MKYPLNPKVELMKWGPAPVDIYYGGEFYASMQVLGKFYPGHFWPKSLNIKLERGLLWINEYPELKKAGGKLFLDYVLPNNRRNKVLSDWEKSIKELQSIEKEIDSTNLKELPEKDFQGLWKKFHKAVTIFWVHSIIPELSNYGSSEILQEKLKSFVPEKEMMHVMEVLTTPEGKSFMQGEEIDLEETKNLEEHQRKYFWIKNNYVDVREMSIDFFRKRKKELEKGLRKKVNERLKEIAKEKLSLKKEYRLSEEIMKIAKMISFDILWQDKRKKEIFIYLNSSKILIEELARRKRYPKEDLLNFTSKEIDKIITKRDAGKIFSMRKPPFAILIDKSLKIYDSQTALDFWKIYFEGEKDNATKEFSGVVASKGGSRLIKGKVRIIPDPKSMHQLMDGEILVTHMTTPEYVFGMKRALAIITDFGGLTSHAAIVSRELNKPCIVGTKIATKILKTGDEIEIDIEKGVVRKL